MISRACGGGGGGGPAPLLAMQQAYLMAEAVTPATGALLLMLPLLRLVLVSFSIAARTTGKL